MEKRISNLSGHTIVCGFGRMGAIICKRLEEDGVTFVVIEKRESLVSMLQNTGYMFIEGDAAHDEILERASIRTAKDLVSVIDSDADGLYIALAGRSYNPDLNIIVRANEESAKRRMLRAGANKVVLPFVMSGLKVAESVANPAVEDFLNIRDVHGENGDDLIQLADLYVTHDSLLIDKKVHDIGEEIEKIIIVGIRKTNHEFIFNPRGDYIFQEGDCIIALGDQTAYKKAQNQFRLANTWSASKEAA